MKKALLFVILLCLPALAFADDPEIKLFGGLSWQEGFLETVARIQKFKPASLKLLVADRRKVFEADLKLDDGPEKLKNTLKTLLEKRFAAARPFKRAKTAYLDKNRREKTLLRGFYSLVAEPVNVKGVPFKLTVTMEPHPALAVLKPDQVFELNIKGKSFDFPLTISGVVLSSSDDALADKAKKLGKPLYKKYKSLNMEPFWRLSKDGLLNGDVSDTYRKLEVKTFVCGKKDAQFCQNKAGMSLIYSNSRRDLDRVYSRHKSVAKKKKMMNQDAPDLGDGF